MLSWLLLILVIAAIAVFGAWVSASIFGRGEALPPMDEPQDVIDANRRAVEEGRFDDIALEVVPRGYRQDQVDALVAQLAGQRRAAGGPADARKIDSDVPAPGAAAPASANQAEPVKE